MHLPLKSVTNQCDNWTKKADLSRTERYLKGTYPSEFTGYLSRTRFAVHIWGTQMQGFSTRMYTVRFVTPAFLAGAVPDKAEWRTPPFKNLIREWWRIVKAPEVRYRADDLRKAEHPLFGHAATSEDEKSGQSKVRLRLGAWRTGTETNLHTSLRQQTITIGRFQSQAALYLGYGPIQRDESRPAISNNNDSNLLRVSVEDEVSTEEIWRALQLAAWFGSIGPRSRNSWGSLSIEGEGIKSPAELSKSALEKYLRSWTDCMELDWPHAIGTDVKEPLIWKTEPKSDWKQVLKDVAKLRYDVRQLFPLNLHSPQLQDRHILAYPIKEPVVSVWGNQARFANQLRLKIISEGNAFRGIITHIPCALPQSMAEKVTKSEPSIDLKAMQQHVWEKVHCYLDDSVNNLSPR